MTVANSNQTAAGPTSILQKLAHRVICGWNSIAQKRSAFFLIIGVWLVVAVPPALFRGYQYREGLTVTIAQSALHNGYWLTPHLYNFRWIERPTLLSWIIAMITFPFGHVDPFVARLPTILSLLVGCVLIWRTLRPVASAAAALVGAASFLAAPIVMRYSWMSLADMPLAVLLFGAFLVWWDSFSTGRLTVGRWISIGCLLAIAALLKGPQPVAYFFLGLFAFTLLTSTWWQMRGLFLAGLIAIAPVALWYAHVYVSGDESQMLRYARLSSGEIQYPHPLSNAVKFFVEAFPVTFLAGTLLVVPKTFFRKMVPHNFILALSCYAFTCTVALLFWPAGVNPRYILPMVLPLCVLAGIGYDVLLQRSAALTATSICIVVGLLGYSAVHSTIGQLLWPETYSQTKIAGAKINELVRRSPAPIYRTIWDAGLNELSYVPYVTTTIDPATISSIAKPAWIVAPTTEAGEIIANGNGHIKSALVLRGSVLLRLE